MLEQNLREAERVLGADHPDAIIYRGHLCVAYGSAGRIEDEIAGDRITLVNHAGLGQAYRMSGRISESISLLKQVLAECERELGRADQLTCNVRADLGLTYMRAGRRREERALFKQQLAVVREHEAAVAARYKAAEPTAADPGRRP